MHSCMSPSLLQEIKNTYLLNFLLLLQRSDRQHNCDFTLLSRRYLATNSPIRFCVSLVLRPTIGAVGEVVIWRLPHTLLI